MIPHDSSMKKGFYGSTTIGTKGQAVIPASARKAMNLKEGDKLLVFGTGHGMICFSKISHVEKLVAHVSKKLTNVKTAIKKVKHS